MPMSLQRDSPREQYQGQDTSSASPQQPRYTRDKAKHNLRMKMLEELRPSLERLPPEVAHQELMRLFWQWEQEDMRQEMLDEAKHELEREMLYGFERDLDEQDDLEDDFGEEDEDFAAASDDDQEGVWDLCDCRAEPAGCTESLSHKG